MVGSNWYIGKGVDHGNWYQELHIIRHHLPAPSSLGHHKRLYRLSQRFIAIVISSYSHGGGLHGRLGAADAQSKVLNGSTLPRVSFPQGEHRSLQQRTVQTALLHLSGRALSLMLQTFHLLNNQTQNYHWSGERSCWQGTIILDENLRNWGSGHQINSENEEAAAGKTPVRQPRGQISCDSGGTIYEKQERGFNWSVGKRVCLRSKRQARGDGACWEATLGGI